MAIQVLHERFGVTGKDVRLAASGAGRAALPEAVEVEVHTPWPA
jgi:hypothetical protein